MSSRSICSIQWVPGQPELQSETLTQNTYIINKKQSYLSLRGRQAGRQPSVSLPGNVRTPLWLLDEPSDETSKVLPSGSPAEFSKNTNVHLNTDLARHCACFSWRVQLSIGHSLYAEHFYLSSSTQQLLYFISSKRPFSKLQYSHSTPWTKKNTSN